MKKSNGFVWKIVVAYSWRGNEWGKIISRHHSYKNAYKAYNAHPRKDRVSLKEVV